MDLLVLRRIATELDEALRGSRIDQVYALPRNDVVLVVGRRRDPRLWFSTEPDHPHLYLRPGAHPTPERPPGFAMAARNALRGRRIASIEWVHGDRVVELTCAGDDGVRIVFELIPRRATALIVGGDGIVSAVWQPRRGRPGLGEVYSPPPPDRRPPVDAVAADVWEGLRGADDETLVRGLLRSIAGMSPLVAREIVHLHREGSPLPEAARSQIERGTEQAREARIYAPAPLSSLDSRPGPRRFFVAPYEMSHTADDVAAGTLHAEPCATMITAAATYYPLRASLGALDAARNGLVGALEIGRARTERTLDAVADDADAAGDATRHRQWADLLLAYPGAERTGSIARVPDAWATATDVGATLEVPIDPSRSLVDNAQSYYQRARRAERSAEKTAARRKSLESRVAALRTLAAEAAAAGDVGECTRIARAATAHRVEVPTSRWTVAEADPGPSPPVSERARPARDMRPAETRGTRPDGATRHSPGVDRYTSSDGFEILVGRNARANERVTHELAAPHDFWLHAEGPGSHVIIRNPGRADAPSDDSLREAASLAAYFSFARGATKVNVRWTRARQVKKPRGAPVGQVTLRAARTYLAAPLAPEDLFGDPEPS